MYHQAIYYVRSFSIRREIEDREYAWLDIMNEQIENIPEDENKFWYEIKDELDMNKFIPSEYGLE